MKNYEEVKFSRSRIEKAGKVIADYSVETTEFQAYLPVVDNWRAAHAFPLDVVTSIVNDSVKDKSDTKVVQRLKRLDSIIGKLQRSENTGLYRMQDLGGCRVIVPDVSDLYVTVKEIRRNLEEKGHEIKREYDYLKQPRINSGYRSFHLVVSFHCEEDKQYEGMFIEIQIRTELEHQWATAVEIMDSITNETLKVGTGKKEYMYFFKLVSALFSLAEGTSVVEGISSEKKKIVYDLYSIDKSESIRDKLSAYNSAIKFSGKYPGSADYYLLITDMRKKTISAQAFSMEEISEATSQYQKIEKNKANSSIDVVLVAAKNFDIIKESYPNYFTETLKFLAKISDFCSEYPEKASIDFSTDRNGVRILDYFNIQQFDKNVENNYIWGGIGASDGRIIICPDWPISLDDSYLRFSGIIARNIDQINSNCGTPIQVSGSAVVVLKTGASFYVDRESWEYYSPTDSAVLQPKEGVSRDLLLFLIGWLKSNICSWDLLWNRHSNSVYRKNVMQNLNMPNPDNDLFQKVCENVGTIIEEENGFVEEVGELCENNTIDLSIIDEFNTSILTYLRNIESLFADYYGLSTAERSIIKQELQLKGYYAYT